MRNFFIILFAFCVLNFTVQPAGAALPFNIVTNVMILTCGDSFDEGPAGNGHWVYEQAALALGYPQVMWRARMVSQAGQNNWGFATNNLASAGLPLVGSMHGTNDLWIWTAISGNGGFASTANQGYYTTNIDWDLKFPVISYSVHGYFTNDWPWATNRIFKRLDGDPIYYGNAAGNAPVYQYNSYGSNSGWSNNAVFVDAAAHTSYETSLYNTDTNLAALQYYGADNTPPALSHSRKSNFQFIRSDLDYQSIGGKTNIFSFTQDWNTASVDLNSTNGIAITGASRTAWVWSGTVKADCLGGIIEIGDVTHTNNNLEAFPYRPDLTNFFGEWMVFSNCPAGNFVWYLDDEAVMTNASANGMLSNNWYHTYKGAWFRQKMAVLDGYRTIRDISTTNASVYVSTTYQKNFNSQVGTYYPTNGGTAAYTASMQPFENTMEVRDVATFNAAQQTPHALTVIWSQPLFVPFHR